MSLASWAESWGAFAGLGHETAITQKISPGRTSMRHVACAARRPSSPLLQNLVFGTLFGTHSGQDVARTTGRNRPQGSKPRARFSASVGVFQRALALTARASGISRMKNSFRSGFSSARIKVVPGEICDIVDLLEARERSRTNWNKGQRRLWLEMFTGNLFVRRYLAPLRLRPFG